LRKVNPLFYLMPVGAYLYGAVPFGYLLARLLKGVDLRDVGSGNVGATNAARVLGWRFFPLVFVLDFSKGFLSTLAGTLLAGKGGAFHPHPLAVACAIGAVLGHAFPVYLGFKGGKAVATSTGTLAVLAPKALLVAVAVWVGVLLVWRYVSLASICAAAALAVFVWVISKGALGQGIPLTVFATFGALLVIVLHRSNIKRLLAGTENKVSFGGKKEENQKSDEL
jgi:glycerol-3-phosphate acyltransferase PlsY